MIANKRFTSMVFLTCLVLSIWLIVPVYAQNLGRNTYYVRLREYTTKPMDGFDPKGDTVKLRFGDDVSLVEKSEGTPSIWLVSTDNRKAWIPFFYLTNNQREIEFLRKVNKIPSTMSFVYEKDGTVRVYGFLRTGFLLLESYGLCASDAGSFQVANEGNAVMFDSAAVKRTWTNPIIMGCGTRTYKLRTDTMYYCTSVDSKGNGCFVCIDLRALSICKD